MFNDFRARMDWCVMDYEQANHPPRAVLNGDNSDAILRFSAPTGETIAFDADGSSDPDNDRLRYHWWVYSEAGQRPYGKPFPLDGADEKQITLTLPVDAAGKEIHLILEVWDRNESVSLVDYRRAVIKVDAAEAGR
jgi:hypothetical protein